jgi:hypothetical protein
MSILTFIRNLFVPKPLSQEEMAIKVIKQMGYKKEKDGSFSKISMDGRNYIYLDDKGVKIKAYGSVFSETEFLKSPIDDKAKLIAFIRYNQA